MINVLCINCSDKLLEKLSEPMDNFEFVYTVTTEDKDAFDESFINNLYNPIIIGLDNNTDNVVDFIQQLRKSNLGIYRLILIENYTDLDPEEKIKFKLLNVHDINYSIISAESIEQLLAKAHEMNTNIERIMYEYF